MEGTDEVCMEVRFFDRLRLISLRFSFFSFSFWWVLADVA